MQIQADSILQVWTHSLTSDFSSSIRGERHNSLKSFVSYYSNNTLNIRHISWCFRSQFIFAGRDPKNLTVAAMVENSMLWQRTPFSAPMAEVQLSACMVRSQILNCIVRPQLLNTMVVPQLNLFFKFFQILSPSLPSMISSTLQPNFLSGVYYDNGDCHILCVRA